MVRKVCGWLMLGAWLVAACGGRAIDDGTEPDGAGGTSGTGGKGHPNGKAGSSSSSTAGVPATGTSGSTGIGVGAAPATGGTFSAGGSAPAFGGTGIVTAGTSSSSTGGSGPCACDPFACGPGYTPQPGPGCCPICVPAKDCETGRAEYYKQRTLLIDKYSSAGCQLDSDCGVLYETNACVNGCGQTPLPASLIESAIQNLDVIAQQVCTQCPPAPIPPCVPPPQPRCVMNRCLILER
jgi:hypothetical protein